MKRRFGRACAAPGVACARLVLFDAKEQRNAKAQRERASFIELLPLTWRLCAFASMRRKMNAHSKLSCGASLCADALSRGRRSKILPQHGGIVDRLRSLPRKIPDRQVRPPVCVPVARRASEVVAVPRFQ